MYESYTRGPHEVSKHHKPSLTLLTVIVTPRNNLRYRNTTREVLSQGPVVQPRESGCPYFSCVVVSRTPSTIPRPLDPFSVHSNTRLWDSKVRSRW